jgi:NitT/TauT family transport system substrate-binding protein
MAEWSKEPYSPERGGASNVKHRRSAVASVAAGVLLLAGCGGSGSSSSGTGSGGKKLDKVSFDLAYLMDGTKAPFVIGKEKGFFEEEGIDVKLIEGSGSANTVKFLGNGSVDFGVPIASIGFQGIAQGVPITMVANHQPTDNECIFVKADSGINSIKDLEGHSVVVIGGTSAAPELRGVLKAGGADLSKVKVVEAGQSAAEPAFLKGQYDAFANPYDSIFTMEKAQPGLKLREFFYKDVGYNTMGAGLFVNNATIKDNPDLVRRMTAAYAKSYIYAVDHPEETISVTSKLYPAATPDILTGQLEIAFAAISNSSDEGQPFGWMSDSDVTSTLKLLKQDGGLDSDDPPSAYYTNQFIGDWDHLDAKPLPS